MPLQIEVSVEAAARGALDKIAAARIWLMKEKPFFGVLTRALLVEPSPTLRTAFRLHADDRLVVHPKAVLALPFASLCARLAHLCLHSAFGAHGRRRDRAPERWNVAHDLAVEPLLREARLPTAAGALDGLRAGMSAEEIYELLPVDATPGPEWCDLVDPPWQEGDERSPPPGAPRGTRGDDQIATRSPTPVPSHEVRARELAWRMRLAEALEVDRSSGGKTWGLAPAWIDAMVSAAVAPPPNWTVILQASVSQLSRSSRTFLRPSRRQSAVAFDDGEEWPTVVSMPGRRVLAAGKLVAIVDTSASIEEKTVAVALGAICAAATTEGIEEIRLIQADAEVTNDEILSPADLLTRTLDVKGRGGTSYVPALTMLAREARQTGERFTAVYLTDLDGTFPEKRAMQSLDVLWVTTISRPVPFGRVLRLL